MGAWIRIVICFGTAWMLIRLLVTGELGLFVNPQFTPLVLFGTVLLILLGLVQIWHLGNPALHRTGWLGYGLLLLPLSTFILVPPAALDASMASKKGVNYLSPEAMQSQQRVLTRSEKEARSEETETPNPPLEDSQDTPPVDLEKTPEETGVGEFDPNPYYADIYKKLKKSAVIRVTNENYVDTLTTVQMYSDELEGKPIRVKGFVYRADNMPEGVILVGRYAMTCCAADASVIGYFAKIPHSDSLKDGTWIEVEGGLYSTTVEGSQVPLIQAESHRQVEAPKDPYVYSTY